MCTSASRLSPPSTVTLDGYTRCLLLESAICRVPSRLSPPLDGYSRRLRTLPVVTVRVSTRVSTAIKDEHAPHPLPARRHRRTTPDRIWPHAADEPFLRQPHCSTWPKCPSSSPVRLYCASSVRANTGQGVPGGFERLETMLRYRDTPVRPTLWPRPAIDVQMAFPGRLAWLLAVYSTLNSKLWCSAEPPPASPRTLCHRLGPCRHRRAHPPLRQHEETARQQADAEGAAAAVC